MRKLSNSACLTPETIKQYLEEELNSENSYSLESHLMDCPDCHEAIEAYASTHQPEVSGASVSIPEKKVV